ncbi:MAG: 50S ribosomal protein L2 [Patescibacteria group bacterium]
MKKDQDKIVKKKPNTSALRQFSIVKSFGLSKNNPDKKLIKTFKKSAGRDNLGHISTRHRGGGAKRKYRVITDLAKHIDQEATVLTLEYDPNRTARITKIQFENGSKAYIVAPKGIKVGDKVVASANADERVGNRVMLKSINTGTQIYGVELTIGKGPQIAKSAGNYATLMAKENGMATVKLPSGEVRLIKEECYASIGSVSNELHSLVKIGKAGRIRHMGRRPQVRGKAMNPVDHPHGGGEGNTSVGLKHPKTPWGKPAMGKITRKKNKASNKFIVKRRK